MACQEPRHRRGPAGGSATTSNPVHAASGTSTARTAGHLDHVAARLVLLAAAATAALMVTAAVASACTAMAVLDFDQAAPAPGDEVTGSGQGFQASHGQTQTQDVVLRFDTRDGQELAQATAGADGTIDFSFEVPDDAAGGHHVIVATQRDAQGTPVYGTPARQSLEVAGAGASASTHAPALPAAAERGESGSAAGGQTGPGLALDGAEATSPAVPAVDAGTVALAALALALAAGVAAGVRQRRGRPLTAGA